MPMLPGPGEGPASDQPAPGQTATILLVDDDENVRETAAMALEDCGYRVIEAPSGQRALDIIAGTEPIDLLLIDMVMPGLDGLETSRRARAARRGLKILLASGYGDRPLGADAAEAIPVLSKPYRLSELAAAVQQAIGTPLKGA